MFDPSKPLLMFCALVLALASHARAAEIDAGGSVKLTHVGTGVTDHADATTVWENKNRLKLKADVGDQVIFKFAYEFGFRRANVATPAEQQTIYRLEDLEPVPHRETNGDIDQHVFQNLDRASMQWAGDALDVTAGRQPFAFGSGRTINPTDVFVPYSPFAIDTEDRIGTDGLRVRYPLGDLSELDLGFLMGVDENDSEVSRATYFRSRTTVFEQDIAVMIVSFLDHHLFGLDLQYSLGPIGGWVESAIVEPEQNLGADEREDPYTRVSTGINVLVGTSNTFVFVEYHYNGAGEANRYEYHLNFGKSAYRDAGVYLFGQHYIIPGVQWELTPLLGLTTNLFANVSDGSVMTTAAFNYSVSDDIQAYFGAYLPAGKKGTDLAPTEFGQSPRVAYASLRYYF